MDRPGSEMPELPEVETIRRGLESTVTGATIETVLSSPCRVFRVPVEDLYQLCGQSIKGFGRRGKFLVLELERHYCVFHLGMTGQITVRDPDVPDSERFIRQETTGLQRIRQHPPDRHTHLELHLTDGRQILYRDIRRFGKIHLLECSAKALNNFFAGLGLEPFSGEYRLDDFLKRTRSRKLCIKSLLLDQKFVAGVGNIYADEALFLAGIHPRRRVHTLRRYEKERLFQAIPGVLEAGINFGGTSLRDYVSSDGQSGSNQENLQVYGRGGQPCSRCSTTIQKVVVGQRGTHFCPECQPRSPGRRRSSK